LGNKSKKEEEDGCKVKAKANNLTHTKIEVQLPFWAVMSVRQELCPAGTSQVKLLYGMKSNAFYI
jgi:hypothetical protein